ncbi:MAG: chorismate-binding protein, partial [Bacteroidota bacterium]
IKNEGYDRGFYSGFLGELNFDFETKEFASDLYVNLRCMQIEGNLAHIYVGGGITADSDAESEWLETVNKSQTMKKILF